MNAGIGFRDVAGLSHALDAPRLANALVVVAWEHKQVVSLARALLAEHNGAPDEVPAWDWKDYDGIYVVRIVRDGTRTSSQFERRTEGLNGLPDSCPTR